MNQALICFISTLADKEFVEREDVNGGDGNDGCRRSTRLKEKLKKMDGGDKRRRCKV